MCLTGGATFQVTGGQVGAWQLANRVASSNQANFLATFGNTLDMSLVQLEPANQVSQFYFRPFDDQLASCWRYYCKSYDYATPPGTASTLVGDETFTCISTTAVVGGVRFPRIMRAVPNVIMYGPISGTQNRIQNINLPSTENVASSVSRLDTAGFSTLVVASGAVGNMYGGHYTAESEL